jgi:hypothetical protein
VTFTQAGFDTKRTGHLKCSIAQGNPDRVIMKSGKNTLATPSNSLDSSVDRSPIPGTNTAQPAS